jgi:GT2 family glycosyltransferase
MNKVELFLYNLVKANPRLKRKVRDAYQRMCDWVPVKSVESAYTIEVRKGFFYGFHDKCPWSADNRMLLAHQAPTAVPRPSGRTVSRGRATPVYIDRLRRRVEHGVRYRERGSQPTPSGVHKLDTPVVLRGVREKSREFRSHGGPGACVGMEGTSILTICVSYHNDEEAAGFARGLLNQKGSFAQRVMLVDNTAPPRADSPLRRMSDVDPRVSVCHPGKNLGYFGGARWALGEFTKQFPLPQWVIVCNADMTLVQPDFLLNLCRFHSSGRYAVIAPAITSDISGRDLNPFMRVRPSRLRMRFYKMLFRYYPISASYLVLAFARTWLLRKCGGLHSTHRRMVQSTTSSGQKDLQPQEIYAPHGSFIAFHRRYFESGGTLNHGAFLCGEEFFVAETARRLGLLIAYDPRLQVVHLDHATLSRYTSRTLLRFVGEAAEYVADTFFSAPSPG